MLSDCLRYGARDSAITEENYNAIADFVEGTKIETIFCNGGVVLDFLKRSGDYKRLKVPVVQLVHPAPQIRITHSQR